MNDRFEWRHQYDDEGPQEEAVADATIQFPEGESLTQQQFKGSADINAIVKRAGVGDGSVLPGQFGITDPKYYADLEGVPTLREALDGVMETQERFMRLPADVRSRFHNRPDLLYEFVMNPANAQESVELGLLERYESPGNVEPVKKPAEGGAPSA